MKPSQKTDSNNHKYFYQAIESNKVNIEWLINQIATLNKKLDRLMFLSLSTLISLLITLAAILFSHVPLH